jgi:hypothetical protein
VPGATHRAELGWWAPFAGDIEVTVNAAVPSMASDGVTIDIANASGAILAPVGVAFPTSVWYSWKAAVAQGDELYFRTSSGPAQDPQGDTTSWQIDISMTRMDE